MENQLRKFIRKEILKEVSALGAIASEAGQVSVDIEGWELPPGGFKPIENVVDTLKLQLLDQKELADYMKVYNIDKIPEKRYKEVPGKDVKYDKVQIQTQEFVKKYTNKTDKMKLIGENKMKVTERKLRDIIKSEITNLSEVGARATKGGAGQRGKSISFTGQNVKGTSRSKGQTKFSGKPDSRSAPSKRNPFQGSDYAQRGGYGKPQPTYPSDRRAGGTAANLAKDRQTAWHKSEESRVSAGVAKAKELRSVVDQNYWSLAQQKLELTFKVWDFKWAYATAIVDGNTKNQNDALQTISQVQNELKNIQKQQGEISRDIDWSRYEAGGKKKR